MALPMALPTVTTPLALQLAATAERALAITANNMANAQNYGFQEILPHMVSINDTPGPDGAASFVFEKGAIRNTLPGQIIPTDNPLDFAIQGQGYFSVQTPKGTRYTRNGAFTLNEVGEIVTPQGYQLLDSGGSPIVLQPGSTVSVTNDGIISTEQGVIGSIGVFIFQKPEEMLQEGDNLLNTTEVGQLPEAGVSLRQGSLETSNVSPTKSMARMVEIERIYQMAQKIIEENHSTNMDAIASYLKAA